MPRQLLRELFVKVVDETLAGQRANGDVAEGGVNHLLILPWAVCYSEEFAGNPHFRSPRLLEGIVRLGDFNHATVNDRGIYSSGFGGWDEWRTIAWLEAMKRVERDLDAGLVRRWSEKFIGAAGEPRELIPASELDNFDGLIPNHPTWGYALLYRLGVLFDNAGDREIARRALHGVLRAQTPDGLFREGGTAGGFPGTAVTHYNLVSAAAMDYYFHQSGDELAAVGVEKAWRWFYDFLLPDFSCAPNFDIRSRGWLGVERAIHTFPSAFFRKPEGAFIAREALTRFRDMADRATPARRREVGFLAMQYGNLGEAAAPAAPNWPEYHRMIAGEACVRRRGEWTAVLCGLQNRFVSNVAPIPFFGHERQDCIALHHRDAGLILGSSHSRMQSEIGTFAVYENGSAKYVPDDAFLRSTEVIDTLLLMYGSNVAAASVDTRVGTGECDVTFSLSGERGSRTRRGNGHSMSAIGARAHATVYLRGDEVIRLGEKTWSANRPAHEPLAIVVPAGATLDFGRFRLSSPGSEFEFRWPVRTIDPYTAMGALLRTGVVEFVLYQPTNATAVLRVSV